MSSLAYLMELQAHLTKQDWHFIYYATEDRIIKASIISKEHGIKINEDRSKRILTYLSAMAYDG